MLQYDTDFWLVSERQHPEAWIDCGPESLQRCGISDADQHDLGSRALEYHLVGALEHENHRKTIGKW